MSPTTNTTLEVVYERLSASTILCESKRRAGVFKRAAARRFPTNEVNHERLRITK